MEKLDKTGIKDNLSLLEEGWIHEGDAIKKDFKFSNFIQAFSFMTAVALEAEKLDHHPNWENVYNRVKISLSTHDVSGISLKDFELAAKIDSVTKKM